MYVSVSPFCACRFYKDDSHSAHWGEEKYSGGRGGSSKNFPGVGGRGALVIPSSRFVVYFHSDSSGNGWGYMMTITAAISSLPSMPAPSPVPAPVPTPDPAPAPVPALPTQESLILESTHPYPSNANTFRVVDIAGATGYTVTFDNRSKTEAKHDFIR